ncbi:hypothetical protein SAMN04488034_10281 [Salinimicrobium catena]|uniref:Uncharacterized protein n=1 Tax=Salinimicrobium catena TaxID=390640 RepID=A0A1H5L2M7_9FLAO|nr:hypothetical protein [Salinimicrobium catena]SDL04207.1 hypothetical protein SAMN04488140_10281 [Salinimicrobium catena]SEE70571.1 hypothetical protein SAMN04488034_10281 [Salinimicrobium catena]
MLSNLKIGVARRRMAAAIKRSLAGEEKQSQRIGVILDRDDEDLKEKFLKLKTDLGLRDPDFQMVVCKDEGQKGDVFQGLVFTRKDLGWNGKIRNGEITGFARQKMDVLISYTEADNKLAALLVSVANAGLKVGREEGLSSAGLFNMLISTGFEEVDVFIAELKRYLKILNNSE